MKFQAFPVAMTFSYFKLAKNVKEEQPIFFLIYTKCDNVFHSALFSCCYDLNMS